MCASRGWLHLLVTKCVVRSRGFQFSRRVPVCACVCLCVVACVCVCLCVSRAYLVRASCVLCASCVPREWQWMCAHGTSRQRSSFNVFVDSSSRRHDFVSNTIRTSEHPRVTVACAGMEAMVCGERGDVDTFSCRLCCSCLVARDLNCQFSLRVAGDENNAGPEAKDDGGKAHAELIQSSPVDESCCDRIPMLRPRVGLLQQDVDGISSQLDQKASLVLVMALQSDLQQKASVQNVSRLQQDIFKLSLHLDQKAGRDGLAQRPGAQGQCTEHHGVPGAG